MSVDVKTPPHFQHKPDFACGRGGAIVASCSGLKQGHISSSTTTSQSDQPSSTSSRYQSRPQNTNNNSDSVFMPNDNNQNQRGNFNRGQQQQHPNFRRRRSQGHFRGGHDKYGCSRKRRHNSEKIVLPTKFLLGGNINDPLNLNEFCDEEVSKALNELTPVSSPLPTPAHRRQCVDVLIPANMADPLNLNSGDDVELAPKLRKKKRPKYKKKGDTSTVADTSVESEKSFTTPLSVEVNLDRSELSLDLKAQKKIEDKIVSPVIPQCSPKSRKRKRHSSECKPDPSLNISRSLLKTDEDVPAKPDQVSPGIRKYKRQHSGQKHCHQNRQKSRPNEHSKKFIYGNYNRYYGYRNPETEDDMRLKCLQQSWIDNMDVLDIGCNVGHLTLSIAKYFNPRKIVGIDIDQTLIKAARKNIRHYLSTDMVEATRFPVAMSMMYGPIASRPLPDGDCPPKFPNNVLFIQGNYTLESDELLELQKEEYDVILGLSLTKWIHLNFGDDGLKRSFKRMYRQLRPGGRLILEPQSWCSYKKKKKLTSEIFKMFQAIKFKPEQFTEYLLSKEVGFSTCQMIDVPFNKSKGFRRPIQMYTKPDRSRRESTDASRSLIQQVMERLPKDEGPLAVDLVEEQEMDSNSLEVHTDEDPLAPNQDGDTEPMKPSEKCLDDDNSEGTSSVEQQPTKPLAEYQTDNSLASCSKTVDELSSAEQHDSKPPVMGHLDPENKYLPKEPSKQQQQQDMCHDNTTSSNTAQDSCTPVGPPP